MMPAELMAVLLPLLLIGAILMFSIALLGVYISAIGLAQENGRNVLALVMLLFPVVGWCYAAGHWREVRWVFKFLLLGLACLGLAVLLGSI